MGPAVPLYLASSGSLVLDIMLMESATQWAQQSHYVWLAMSSIIADSFYKLQKMNVWYTIIMVSFNRMSVDKAYTELPISILTKA